MSIAVDPPRAGSLGTATDQQLTELVRRGHSEAFRALYARHSALLTTIALSTSRDRARAEDITQEAWAAAYRALSRPGAPIDNVAGWLGTICRNAARDRFRRDRLTPEPVGDEVTARIPAPGGVEESLNSKQRIGRLMGAMDELNDEQRQILNLREFSGLTYQQIAAQIDKPVSTVETALFRARRKAAVEYEQLHCGARCATVQDQLSAVEQLSRAERRRLSRHLARCVSCERVARLEGAEDLIPEPRLARIAGTLPLPGILARTMAGGTDLGPLIGKAAVVAAVAVGGGVLAVGGHDAPSAADAQGLKMGGSSTTTAAASSARSPVVAPSVTSSAPVVVRAQKITAVSQTRAASGKVPSVRVQAAPVTAPATNTAGAAPSAPSTTTTERKPVAATPAPRKHTTSTSAPAPTLPGAVQNAAQPVVGAVQQTAGAVTGAVQQTTGAVQQAAAPVTQAVAKATQPVQQAAKPAVNRVQNTVTQATNSTGPTVKQTVVCLTSDCRVGG